MELLFVDCLPWFKNKLFCILSGKCYAVEIFTFIHKIYPWILEELMKPI